MIRSEVQKRKIKNVLHFTKIENLSSIIQHGLLPREDLNSCNIAYQYNDEIRVDHCENATCFSISFPNYKMFYSYRIKDTAQKWIVIFLSPKLLWEKDCAFCYSNAASSEISSIPLADRKRPESFLKMFDEFEEYPKRSELKIKNCYPTNPQAEVLVFDLVERAYFNGFYFQDHNAMLSCQNSIEPLKKFPCKYGSDAFSYRDDYEYWKTA